MDNLLEIQPYTTLGLQTYTPGSDIAAGFEKNQIVWGRTGNDVVVGYQPAANNIGQPNIDILIGDAEIPLLQDPEPRDWTNRFILGDWQKSYYLNSEPFSFGLNDFALISDFNPNKDLIQLHGTPQDYQLTTFSPGTEIWLEKTIAPDFTTVLDLVAILPTFELSLDADYFLFTGNTPPQGPAIKQAQQLGTSDFDVSSTVTTDLFGNVYVAGSTNGSLGGTNNAESRDVWVAKYDSKGNQQWIKQFGSSSFDYPFGIATDNAGNLYLAGSTQGDLAATKQAELYEAWVAKYDTNGNQLWVQQFGSGYAFNAYALDVDGNGNAYLSGVTVNTTAGGSVLPTTDDAWVAKYDTNGNQLWFQQFGSLGVTAFDESFGIAVDKSGNIYSTGFTTGNLAADNTGLYDAWIAKHDENGQLAWIRQFGTEDYDWAWGVDTDNNGNIYASGWTLGSLGGENAGSFDAWLTKFDSKGNQLWTRQFGTPGDDELYNMFIDSHDNIFLTGYTNNNLGGLNFGSYDAWVVKYDSDGNQLWVQQFGTPQLEQAYGITVDNTDNLYVTGLSDGSLGGINAGSFDAWITKFDAVTGIWEEFSSTSNPTGLFDGSLGGINTGFFDAWITKFDAVTGIWEEFSSTSNPTGLSDGSLGGINAGFFDAWITKFDAVTGIWEEFSSTSNPVNASPATNLPAADQ